MLSFTPVSRKEERKKERKQGEQANCDGFHSTDFFWSALISHPDLESPERIWDSAQMPPPQFEGADGVGGQQ